MTYQYWVGFYLLLFCHLYRFYTPKILSGASKSNLPSTSKTTFTVSSAGISVHNIVLHNRELHFTSTWVSSEFHLNPERPQIMVPGWGDIILQPTNRQGSIPRCHLKSNSLVCIENHLFIVGIGPILNKGLGFIYQSDCSYRTCIYS